MAQFSRRGFLRASGLLAAGAASVAVAGCDTAPKGGGKSGTLHWWDHREPLQNLHKKIFAEFAKESGGMPVEYSYHQTGKMGQALQLAKQSKQLPDVFTDAGLRMPLAALVKQGWLRPLEWGDDILKRFPAGSVVEGLHTYQGKVYSFPIFTHKQYWAANFFNSELLEKVGLDPASPPTSYDEFRSACRTVRSKGGDSVYGWVFNLNMPPRVAEQIIYLAHAAGAGCSGGGGPMGGIDFRTGEYAFHTEPFMTVIEFLLSLQKDKLLLPGSESMDDKAARARWATGVAAFYFDGPWCPGVVKGNLGAFADKMAVGPMLVPTAGTPVRAYKGPDSGAFFCSKTTRHPDVVSQLLTHFCDSDYHLGLAENMAQPPLDPTVVEKADVHPSYRELLRLYEGTTFLAPNAAAGNPDAARAEQELKPVKPGLGEIVQGIFTGDVSDAGKALRKLSDDSNKALDAAIAAASQQGAKLSRDDFAFPDWQPGADYGPDKYGT